MPDGNLIADVTSVAVRTAETRTPTPQPLVNDGVATQTRLAQGTPRTPELTLDEFSEDQLRDVASAFGDVVSLVNRDLRIIIDESTGRIVTQIVDGDTNEVVRQLPPEALLDVARRVADLVGLLVDEEL